jgi:hypothetical protein
VASVQVPWAAVSLQGRQRRVHPTAFGPASFTYIIGEQGGATATINLAVNPSTTHRWPMQHYHPINSDDQQHCGAGQRQQMWSNP